MPASVGNITCFFLHVSAFLRISEETLLATEIEACRPHEQNSTEKAACTIIQNALTTYDKIQEVFGEHEVEVRQITKHSMYRATSIDQTFHANDVLEILRLGYEYKLVS